MKLIKNMTFTFLATSSLLSASLQMDGGSVIGKNIYGVINDFKENPIILDKTAIIPKDSTYTGFINVKNKEENSDFIISSFHSESGIGALYVTKTKLEENKIIPINTQALDLAAIGGVYSPTKGYKTPWNTFIFTQDKLIDGKNDKKFIKEFAPYFQNKINLVDSYKYGWPFELVVLNPKGDAKVLNQYAMGRTFASDIIIMPDKKTVYMFDGKYSKNLYMFISDKAEDFMKGTLYAAKLNNNSIKWIQIAKQNALKVKLKFRRTVKFSSLYKSKKPTNGMCPKKYSLSKSIYGEECLSVNKRSKKYVGVFDPIRESARLGASSFDNGLTSMAYDAQNNMVLFKMKANTKMRFNANNKALSSQYIIK